MLMTLRKFTGKYWLAFIRLIYEANKNAVKEVIKIFIQCNLFCLQDPLREAITIYKPSVEIPIDDGNTFLTEHPRKLAVKGDYNKVPWIFGVNSDEGLITSALILANTTMASVAKNDWRLFIERVLWFNSTSGIAAEKIRQFYFGDYTSVRHPDPFETLDNYTTMISDRGFNYDAHHGALNQSKHSPVYLYYYTYRGEWSAVNYFKEIRGAWPRLVEVNWQQVYIILKAKN